MQYKKMQSAMNAAQLALGNLIYSIKIVAYWTTLQI